MHLDDVVDAIERAIERRAELPPETAILIGEPDTLSYDELQHTFMRLLHKKSAETQSVPGLIAKVGAWVQDLLPGEQFIKPWMIDRANDHYALDIARARTLLDWQPKRSLRQTLPKMVAALEADPIGWYREHGLEPPSSLKKKVEREKKAAAERPAPPEPAPAAEQEHAHPTEASAFPDGRLVHICPMHPEVAEALPGNCPRCGLSLEPATLPVEALACTCPMRPEVASGEPGRCPKCGMPLELRQVPGEAHA